MAHEFGGEVALITGAGSGIGRATAMRLAGAGARVVCADINVASAAITALALGTEATSLQMDVSKEADWRRAVDHIVKQHDGLHLLANIAGIGIDGQFETFSLESWNRMMAVNFTGVFLGCKNAIKAMVATNRPWAIVNMASIGGVICSPDTVAYSAMKAGVIHLSKAVAIYCASRGYQIRCNAVNPTYVDTEMLRGGLERAGMDVPAALKCMAEMVPVGRVCTAEDVAEAVLYLLSQRSSMVNAVDLNVDGGQSVAVASAHSPR